MDLTPHVHPPPLFKMLIRLSPLVIYDYHLDDPHHVVDLNHHGRRIYHDRLIIGHVTEPTQK
jgi:hypothetical protein